MRWNRKFFAYFRVFLALRFAIVLYALVAVDLCNLKSYIDCQTCTAFHI